MKGLNQGDGTKDVCEENEQEWKPRWELSVSSLYQLK